MSGKRGDQLAAVDILLQYRPAAITGSIRVWRITRYDVSPLACRNAINDIIFADNVREDIVFLRYKPDVL